MKRNYDAATSFLDLLFNTLLGFVALFALSFIMMNTEKSKKDIEAKAEFIIIVTWPDDYDDDVDTYVEDPEGNLIYYNSREKGLMHLDRDDIGQQNDTIKTSDGEIKFKDNREIATLRNIVPGEYTVNIHMYRKNDVRATPVTIQIDKINPYSIVTNKVLDLKSAEEKTVIRFTVDANGNVAEVSNAGISLIEKHAIKNEPLTPQGTP
jgi:hypothetical protein